MTSGDPSSIRWSKAGEPDMGNNVQVGSANSSKPCFPSFFLCFVFWRLALLMMNMNQTVEKYIYDLFVLDDKTFLDCSAKSSPPSVLTQVLFIIITTMNG